MSNTWGPVLAALAGSLIIIIGVVTAYIKALLESQTAALKEHVTAVTTQQAAAVQSADAATVQAVRQAVQSGRGQG